MVCPTLQTKDDVYCYSLAKALYYVVSPVTVGFYSPWGRCTDLLLNKIETYLCLESLKKEQDEVASTRQRIRKCNGKDLIKLIFLMIFYHPVITEKHKERENIHFIFIRFSAWEYAGSDHLWAGLVTTLCDDIENHFGLIPISVYRAVSGKTKIIDAPLKQEWVSKKFLCLPLWTVTILVILIDIGVGALFIVYGFPLGDPIGNMLAIAESVGAAVIGISAVGILREVIATITNTIITQKGVLQKKMNRTDMSSQLGFMSDVKHEVQIITQYLQLMEIFQGQKIKVVLEITNLDSCMPEKVVGVLNAMNILLSDPSAPFISILAVDPGIIVECIESSRLMKGMANNGYQFLNRIITLPFCIPKMDRDAKCFLMEKIIEGPRKMKRETEEENATESLLAVSDDKKPLLHPQSTCDNHFGVQDFPLNIRCCGELGQPSNFSADNGPKTKTLIHDTFKYLFDLNTEGYITDNVVHIKRMVNTLTIMIRLMIRKVPRTKIRPHKVTEWVLLATQWPCRLSWILQCIEDEQQKRGLDQTDAAAESSIYAQTLLWDVFQKSLEELDAIKTSLTQLLELDGDPEIFHKLLKRNLTVADANVFLPYTVNLDQSIKRQMELLRGSNGLWEAKKSQRLNMLTLLNMSVDEVCKEMSKLGFQEENLQLYRQKIRDNNLNGKALVYSDNNEIRHLLCMGLGDWTLFSVYFLGVLPPPPAAPITVPAFGQQESQTFGIGSNDNILKRRSTLNYTPRSMCAPPSLNAR